MTAPILEMDRVTRAFGGLIAVSEASLTLDPGELVGLVGPNGAGKSTTFNLACGYLAPTDGIVRFKGESIADSHPSELARRGLGRTFQTPVAFPDLSVAENVMVGQPLPRPLGQALLGRWRPQERQRCRRLPTNCWSRWAWRRVPTTLPGTCRGASSACSRWPVN